MSSRPRSVAVLIGEGAYGVLDTMARRLADAFENENTRVLRIDAEYASRRASTRKVIEDVCAFGPEIFVSMNLTGVVEIDGMWLPDLLKIPCVSWLVDHPAYFINPGSPLYQLRASPYYNVAVVDPAHLEFLRRFYPSERLFFLPHATIAPSGDLPRFSERRPAAVMTAGVGRPIPGSQARSDPEASSENGSWMRRAMRIVQQSVLADQGLDVYHQIEGQLRLPPSDNIDVLAYPISAFEEVETRLRQEIRRTMVTRLAESLDIQIDIYGDEAWKDRQSEKIRYCGKADYRTVPELFRQYQYVLNPQPPQTRNGSHERVMDSISAGTLPITLTSEFYRSEFGDSIVHVRMNSEELSANMADVSNYDSRLAEAANVVRQKHTWGDRVRSLLGRFAPKGVASA